MEVVDIIGHLICGCGGDAFITRLRILLRLPYLMMLSTLEIPAM